MLCWGDGWEMGSNERCRISIVCGLNDRSGEPWSAVPRNRIRLRVVSGSCDQLVANK